MTGLRVNGRLEVLDTNADPIPGLYAGFYTAGGICGECCYAGQFGNPSFAGGVAMSGIGGFLAARARAIGQPVTEDDLSEEAKAANEASKKANSERYLAEAADGSYMKDAGGCPTSPSWTPRSTRTGPRTASSILNKVLHRVGQRLMCLSTPRLWPPCAGTLSNCSKQGRGPSRAENPSWPESPGLQIRRAVSSYQISTMGRLRRGRPRLKGHLP